MTIDRDAELAALHEHFGDDPLDPALLRYMSTDDDGRVSIRHPLVYSIWHSPMMNRYVNQMLEQKLSMLDRYYTDKDWHGVVWAHERPYRLNALVSIANRITDRTWWELVASVWMDSENIRQNPDEWEDILRSNRQGREHMMDADDLAQYDALPSVLDVYQGCTDERDDGWSWTTDLTKAEWFARRFALMEDAEPRLRAGRCSKASMTSYLTGRGESEVIIAPELVIDVVWSVPT